MVVLLNHMEEEILEAEEGEAALGVVLYLACGGELVEDFCFKFSFVHFLVIDAITEGFKFLIAEFLVAKHVKLIENVFHSALKQQRQHPCLPPHLCKLLLIPSQVGLLIHRFGVPEQTSSRPRQDNIRPRFQINFDLALPILHEIFKVDQLQPLT